MPDAPMAHILPHWNFPDRIGKITPVFVYSSGDEVELFLNGEDVYKRQAFHVKIHIENEAIRKKTFHATFEDKETLDEILSILQISAKYKMEKKRGEIYIY